MRGDKMSDEIDAMMNNLPAEVESYSQVRKLAKSGDFPKAIEALKASAINESTKTHLELILESRNQYVVNRTFGELDSRIMQALCWDCWKES